MVERATLNLQTFADGRSPPDLMLPGMQSPTGAHAVGLKVCDHDFKANLPAQFTQIARPPLLAGHRRGLHRNGEKVTLNLPKRWP